MKIERDPEGRFIIQPENPQEEKELDAFKAEITAFLPELQELWEKDLVVLSKLTDIVPLKGATISFPEKPSVFGTGTPVAIRLQLTHGRPMDQRTLLACMRLLLGAPFEKVLAQEKEWRIKEYCNKLSGKSVISEQKKARNNALRDAHMCLQSASITVEKFLNQHPDLFPKFAMFQTVIREIINTNDG